MPTDVIGILAHGNPSLRRQNCRAYFRAQFFEAIGRVTPSFTQCFLAIKALLRKGAVATLMHECGHSTLAEKRLDRKEALGKRWGDAAYSLEELRAEICSAILAAETGVPMSQDADHIGRHASYLNSWVKVIGNDPMVIFSAAKDADRMASYMLGLAQENVAMAAHKEWVAAYDGQSVAMAMQTRQ